MQTFVQTGKGNAGVRRWKETAQKVWGSVVSKVQRWQEKAQDKLRELTLKALMPLRSQEGATVIEILGYALIAVLAIVLIWGLMKGWLPQLWSNITGKIDNLS
ncbi:hypothetical protein KIH86_08450 [Paenibacillus sp. HN-1]|uniref:Flp family type IVb pilin n=1 Tax=Paenibacillus TaxID=44249 RepID=UPI000F993F14|nr:MULTISPECIES: hypothetical protein [Paenibacillus]MBY9079580.1 hypothetical protein [Paenibacillus sp. CGMCC 1.18879]MBY9084269.1 hypothetical protein [Paenibacillus sinensis]